MESQISHDFHDSIRIPRKGKKKLSDELPAKKCTSDSAVDSEQETLFFLDNYTIISVNAVMHRKLVHWDVTDLLKG